MIDPLGLDTEEKEVPPEKKGYSASTFFKDTLGTVQQGLDVVGSLPGLVGAGAAEFSRLRDRNRVERTFPEVINEMMSSASKGNIMDYIPGSEQNRNTAGYQKAGEVIDAPFQGIGNLSAAISKLLGSSDEEAATAGEYGKTGSLAAGMIAGALPRRLPARGTREFYLEQEKNRIPQSQESVTKARSTYLTPEEPLAPKDTANFFNDPQGLFKEPTMQPNTYSPEELRRMEEEAAQGELRSNLESQETGRRAETGTKDMFQNTGLEQPFEFASEGVGARDKIPAGRISEEINPSFDQTAGGTWHGDEFMPGTGKFSEAKGGATEMSNMGADLFRPGEDMASVNNSGIPYEPTKPKLNYNEVFGKEELPSEKKPRYLPYSQRGNITPGVFLEGIQKLLGFKPSNMEIAKSALERKISESMDRRDTFMRPLYEKKLEEVSKYLNKGEVPDKQNPLHEQIGREYQEYRLNGLGKEESIQRLSHLYPRRTYGEIKNVIESLYPEVDRAKEYSERVISAMGKSQRGSADVKQIAEGVSGLVGKFRRKPGEISDARREEIRIQKEKDSPLIRDAKEGDVKAFGMLFKESQRKLERFIRQKTGNESDVPDLLQKTALKAFENLDRFDPEKSSFNTWLHQIAENVRLDEWRKSQAEKRGGGREGLALTEEELSHNLDASHMDTGEAILMAKQETANYEKALDEALFKLPSLQANAFKMHFEALQDGVTLSGAEMAEKLTQRYRELGDETTTISPENARKSLQRARETIEKELSAKFGGKTTFGRYQRGSILPDPLGIAGWLEKKFSKQVQTQGHMGTAKEIAAQFDLEKSKVPLSKILESIGIKTTEKRIWDNAEKTTRAELSESSKEAIKNIQDIGDKFLIASKGLVDKSISILSEKQNGAGQLIKWVTDNEKMIDQARDNREVAALKGEKWVKGTGWLSRGWEHRADSMDGILTAIRSMAKASMKEAIEFKDIVVEATSLREKPQFRTDKQREVWRTMQARFNDALIEANKQRKLSGLSPIKALEDFYPSMWKGDYRIAVKNSADQTTHYYGFDNKYKANAFRKKLVETMPEQQVSGAMHVRRGKYDLDTSAFEEAMRAMSKEDDVSKALKQAYVEIVGHKGFGGKRALEKTGVKGFMGSEKGTKGLNLFEEASELYIKKMYNYAANLEKSRIKSQIADLPTEVRKAMPNAVEWSNSYLDRARGADQGQLQLVDSIIEGAGRLSGFGESGLYRTFGNIRSIASTMFLATGKFALSQVPQSINSLAKMADMAGEAGRSPALALNSVMIGISRTLKPDQAAIDAVNWARRTGKLDSAIVAMMHTDLASGKSRFTEGAKKVIGFTFGKLEQEAVRIPSFLMFEDMLRKTEPNVKLELRYQKAAELMDYYMVNYRDSAKPEMYSIMGKTVGENAAQLKQYSHQSFGAFFEYLQTAKDKERVAPLATYFGTQALIGGLKGTLLVAEADAIINLLNYWGTTDDPIPTVSELFMTSGLSDALVFGVPSAVLGADISGSVGAPSIGGFGSIPAAEYAFKIAKDVGTAAGKSTKGTMTRDDAEKALMTVAPNATAKVLIERMFTEDGQPVRNPYSHDASYRRTEGDWMQGIMVGTKSVNEAKALAETRMNKQDIDFVKQQRASALSAIADRVEAGKEVSPELVQKYIREGGSMSGLQSAIKQEIMGRNMTYSEKKYTGSPTNAKARELEILRNHLQK